MRRFFERQFNTPEQGWRFLRFHSSFRSGQSVLGSVDRVFAAREVYTSITTDEVGIPEHQALPDAAPGLVELWPLLMAEDKREIEGWDAPFDTESEVSPARAPCSQDRRACETLDIERHCKAGDVLVLVRQRGPLFEAIIRALKEKGVPVAGADRLVLTEHIAVMDLLALADALLLPDDDLALACVLKSPLFGLSEEQLFDVAWKREGSLRDSLREQTGFRRNRTQRCSDFANAARQQTPFGFFAYVLGARGGRKQILARLGPEANDALDEFLNLALDYETRETPSLQGFVDWLRKAQSDVRARHGDGARRSAGDDRARRQGPRGKHRHSRRHHDRPRTAWPPAETAQVRGKAALVVGAKPRATTRRRWRKRAKSWIATRATNIGVCSMSR